MISFHCGCNNQWICLSNSKIFFLLIWIRKFIRIVIIFELIFFILVWHVLILFISFFSFSFNFPNSLVKIGMFPPSSSSSSLSSSSKSIFPKFSSIFFAASLIPVFFISLPPKYFFWYFQVFLNFFFCWHIFFQCRCCKATINPAYCRYYCLTLIFFHYIILFLFWDVFHV